MSKSYGMVLTKMVQGNQEKSRPLNLKMSNVTSSGNFNAIFLKNLEKSKKTSQVQSLRMKFNNLVKELKKSKNFENLFFNIVNFFTKLNFKFEESKNLKVKESKKPELLTKRFKVQAERFQGVKESKQFQIPDKSVQIISKPSKQIESVNIKKLQETSNKLDSKKIIVKSEKLSIDYVESKIKNKEETATEKNNINQKTIEINKVPLLDNQQPKAMELENKFESVPKETGYLKEVSELFNTLVHKARIQVSDNKSSIQMNLKSENLGSFNLKLVVEDGILNGKIIVDNNQAYDLLKTNINFLNNAFSSSGFQVQDFEVSVRNGNRWNFEERQNFNNKEFLEDSFKVLPQFDFYDEVESIVNILI